MKQFGKSEAMARGPSRFLLSAVMPDELPALATPAEVAQYLHTTTASLAQDRYKGTGPRFIKRGRRVLYRRSDVLEWLDRNTIQRTDDPRQQR
jgi:predicted DNA-binding transcriptional regulator AlpA